MQYADILYDAADGVARITINRPAVMNAFLRVWLARLAKIGPIANGKKDRSITRF